MKRDSTMAEVTMQAVGRGDSIPKVILASSVGTMIEWYDFYIFGSLASILALKFYPPGKRYVCLHCLPGDVCGGVSGATVWRAVLWPNRRPGGAQVCVSGDADDYGRGNGSDRADADVQDGGVVFADCVDPDPGAAGACAGWGVWRCGGVCCRECAG